MLAVLTVTDLLFIVAIVVVCSAGAAATAYFRPADRDRLQRVEAKLDLLLKQTGVDYAADTSAPWQEVAADPSRKIQAIAIYRKRAVPWRA